MRNTGPQSMFSRAKMRSEQRQSIGKQKVVSLTHYKKLVSPAFGPSILVVDDDELIRHAVKRGFETQGFAVSLAQDALELSDYLEHKSFDLFIIDLKLPWVSGIELVQMLKSHPAFSLIPVIMISGSKTKDDVEAAYAAGCEEFISKPFDLKTLTDLVVASITRRENLSLIE